MRDKYVVIRDTREQKNNGWWFGETELCAGTEKGTLKTGDYSLRGLESIFTIERKRSTGELAKNIFEKRWWRELERMGDFAHPFLMFEFDIDMIRRFPRDSGIPQSKWPELKVSANLLLRKYMEIEIKYKPKIILAPYDSKGRAILLFKYVSEMYESKRV